MKYKVHHSTIDDIKNGVTWNPERAELSRISKIEKMRGENSPSAKLTEKEVKQIRKLCKQGCYSQKTIAKSFNVSHNLINLINLKRIWRHI